MSTWNRHKLTTRDYEGYGVYERDLGRSLGGSYELSGMDGTLGQLPDLGALEQVQMVNGLAHVPLNVKMAAKGALEMLTYSPKETTPWGSQTGTASYVLGSFPTPWIDNLVAQGHVVMVQRSSVPTGTVKVTATFDPTTIVSLVGKPNADWVIIEANPAALAAAEAQAGGGGATPGGGGGGLFPTLPKTGDPCPPGTTGTAWPSCVPQIPGTTPPPDVPVEPPPPEKKPLPKWVVPAALGAGVLVVGAVVLSKKGRRSGATMAANRGRYRAWG